MFRIVTYNVHRCLGSDGQVSPSRIAHVIAETKPDIVALQELDVRRKRTGGIDQVKEIAAALNMEVHFHPVFHVHEERYGDAILTAHRSHLVKAGNLPGPARPKRLEPRGALWVDVRLGKHHVQVINTHLGLLPHEQQVQLRTLLGKAWLSNARCSDPRMIVGDLNTVRRSGVYRHLATFLDDAKLRCRVERRLPTFPARFPMIRIDHAFVSPGITVRGYKVFRSPLARIASDHLPVVVDFEIAEAAQMVASAAA